jgi:hypothetical protein
MAFYNGMMPGITKMVESMAGDAAAQKGYRQAAMAEAAIANARRDNIEGQLKAREYQDAEAGSLNFVLGQHGLEAKRFKEFVDQANGRAPAGGFSPEEVAKYNAALRDYGALRWGGEQHLGSYVGNMAKAPGEAAESSIKTGMAGAFNTGQGAGPYRTAAELMAAGNTALGRGGHDSIPADVKTWQWLQTQPPEVRAAFDKREMAIRAAGASPGATVMTPVPMLGPDGKTTVYGYPSKQGGDIKPTTAVVPTPAGQAGPQSAVGKLMNDVRKGYVGGAQTPSAGGQQQRKLVGTSGGKPVYEVNGKRYIEE